MGLSGRNLLSAKPTFPENAKPAGSLSHISSSAPRMLASAPLTVYPKPPIDDNMLFDSNIYERKITGCEVRCHLAWESLVWTDPTPSEGSRSAAIARGALRAGDIYPAEKGAAVPCHARL